MIETFLRFTMIFKILTATLLCLSINSFGESRTIRTRIYTNENGTKELILDKDSDLPQHEIDFLLQDLNNITVTTEKNVEVKDDDDDEKEEEEGKVLISVVKKNGTKNTVLNDDILMKHWNTLTEVGWSDDNFRRPVKKMYVNNTRILKFGPRLETTTAKVEVNETDLEPIEGRKMDLEEDLDALPDNETETNPEESPILDVEEPSKSRSIWDIFNHLYQCVEHYSFQSGLFKCLSMRVNSLFHGKSADEGLELEEKNGNLTDTEGRRYTKKSIYHSKRFMYNVLLPLLVTIIIKYLLALPFIVLGILTTKTFWLSLLSAGAVTFGDMMKKRDFNIVYNRSPGSKKFGQVQGSGVVEVNSVPPGSNLYWSQLPVPWSVSKSDNRVVRMIPIDDKFYM